MNFASLLLKREIKSYFSRQAAKAQRKALSLPVHFSDPRFSHASAAKKIKSILPACLFMESFCSAYRPS
jgi:hypothetical protein